MYRLVPRDIIHESSVVFVTYKGRPKKKRVRSVPLHDEILPMVLRRAEEAKKSGGVIFSNCRWHEMVRHNVGKPLPTRCKPRKT
tara:strand:+ start:618 stop:869 length:252 start_codon:yes stop_codon:yes gene_type:complete